jgi:hypothetical protein
MAGLSLAAQALVDIMTKTDPMPAMNRKAQNLRPLKGNASIAPEQVSAPSQATPSIEEILLPNAQREMFPEAIASDPDITEYLINAGLITNKDLASSLDQVPAPGVAVKESLGGKERVNNIKQATDPDMDIRASQQAVDQTGPGPDFSPNETGLERSTLSEYWANQVETRVNELVEEGFSVEQANKLAAEEMGDFKIPSEMTNPRKALEEGGTEQKTIAGVAKRTNQRKKSLRQNPDSKYAPKGNKERFQEELNQEIFGGIVPENQPVSAPLGKKATQTMKDREKIISLDDLDEGKTGIVKGTGKLSSTRMVDADKAEINLDKDLAMQQKDDRLPEEIMKELEMTRQAQEQFDMNTAKGQEQMLDYFGDETAAQAAKVRSQLDSMQNTFPDQLDFAANPLDERNVARSMAKETLDLDAASKRVDEIMKEVQDTTRRLQGYTSKDGRINVKRQLGDQQGSPSSLPSKIKMLDRPSTGKDGRIEGERMTTEANQAWKVYHAKFSQAAERARETGDLTEIEALREQFMGDLGRAEPTPLANLEGPRREIPTAPMMMEILKDLPDAEISAVTSPTRKTNKVSTSKTPKDASGQLQEQLLKFLQTRPKNDFHPTNLGRSTKNNLGRLSVSEDGYKRIQGIK